MESENKSVPWLDEMESELDYRVTHYLMTEHNGYCEQQKQIKKLLDKFSAVVRLVDENKELYLSAQEHEAYLEYRKLRAGMEALERKYFYLAGQADMMPYIHILRGLSQGETAESRFKINHLHLESWLMELINNAMEEAEKEARKNCKEYDEIGERISELYSRYSFIDAFTDKSRIKEGRAFSSEELQKVSDCLALEDDKRYIEQTELYLKGIRDGYALKEFLEP